MDKMTLNAAQNLAQRLQQLQLRIVLAESCTSGFIAAVLGCIPGISNHLCGSSVVYRDQTKISWLGVEKKVITDHSAVSSQATTAITRGVLLQTPEAQLSLGITVHFGPGAPPAADGLIYLAVCKRDENDLHEVGARQLQLASELRTDRQVEATRLALEFLRDCLNQL